MEEVYIPDLISSYRWFGISSAIAIMGLLAVWRAFRPPGFRLKALAQLGGMLGLLFGLGATLFVAWDIIRTPTIVVAADHLILGNDSLSYQEVSKAFLRPVPQQDRLGQTQALDMAVIELTNGKQWLLSGKQYEVAELIRHIRSNMEAQGRPAHGQD